MGRKKRLDQKDHRLGETVRRRMERSERGDDCVRIETGGKDKTFLPRELKKKGRGFASQMEVISRNDGAGGLNGLGRPGYGKIKREGEGWGTERRICSRRG